MIRSNVSRENSRLFALVAAVVVIAALYLAKIVLLPVALAVLFTFLLAPVVSRLERIHLPRVLAILLVICAFGSGIGIIGWTVAGQLIDVTNHLSDYRENIAEKVAVLHQSHNTKLAHAQHEVQHIGQQLGIADTSDPATRRNYRELGSSPEHPLDVHEVGKSRTPIDSLPTVLHPMAALLLVTVFTFFMLLQREDLRNRLIRITGRSHLHVMTQAMDEAGNRVSRYFQLQLLVNICYGSIIFAAMHFIGLPHAMLWGALAGLLRFIPYIGAPVAALLPTLLSMAVFTGWTHTLIVMAVFFCVEVVTANFLEPHLYGKQTGLSSLAILIAAVFWTLIWGPIGLILSVPLTVCLAVVGGHVPNLEFLKVLLGDQPVMRPEAHFYQRLLASDEREASDVLDAYLKDKPLEDLYDSVVIPALSLSEQDRHRNALDDATATFIIQTTRELVEELGVHSGTLQEQTPAAENPIEPQPQALAAEDKAPPPAPVTPRNVLCLPVRDAADEIAAVMLAQLLERAGHFSQALPLESMDRMLAEIARTQPDLVYLSALPPYAMAHARRAYKKLRKQLPDLEIVIGLWAYSGDPLKAAREISTGEQDWIYTTLLQAVSRAAGPPPASTAPSTTTTPKLATAST
ncbi:MAG: AI-2E family transporter [Acidobacteriaceae bacterium]